MIEETRQFVEPTETALEVELKKTVKELSDIKFALDESAIVAITDRTGKITYVNRKFCEISKYTPDELLGQDHRIINSGFHSAEFFRGLWSTIVKGNVWRGELRNRAKDSSIYWVDTTIVPILDDNERPYQYIAIRYDITESKEWEKRLSQQASLLDKAQDAILVCDLNHRVLFWNKGAEKIYGSVVAEVLGKDVCDVVCNGDRSQFERARTAFETAEEWKADVIQFTKSGRPLTIETRWTLVRNDKGQPDYYLIINTDITERKKAEDQLLRAQRMESIGTLAGGIAHDLNNILSPIVMAIDMLSISAEDDEAQRWLALARENVGRGAAMVKQVLSFARGVEGERTSVQVKHILKELINVLGETLTKSIQVKYMIEPDLDLISADPTQIHQVLMNLAINARDSMPDGGTLTIEAKNVCLDEYSVKGDLEARSGDYVLVNVTDTGCGMEPDVQPRVFEPFFTTKEIGKGTGLGLSTALTIVKSHGGFFKVYSEVGKGSKVSMYLPVSPAEKLKTTLLKKLPYPTGHGELILIVDDEKNIRDTTEATLKKFGYRTVTANDGRQALEKFSEYAAEIDLVLTDIAMPVLDGLSAIQELRRIDAHLVIIATSGLPPIDKNSLDVNAFLTKPFTAEKLLITINDLLGQVVK